MDKIDVSRSKVGMLISISKKQWTSRLYKLSEESEAAPFGHVWRVCQGKFSTFLKLIYKYSIVWLFYDKKYCTMCNFAMCSVRMVQHVAVAVSIQYACTGIDE